MVYTKDGKNYHTPIKIVKDNKVIYTNDPELIAEAGYTEYVKPAVPLSVRIQQSDDSINAVTDERILNDFTYNDAEFYLTMENQTNFANMFIAREFLEYPQTVKTKTGFIILANKEEVQNFYLAGVNFVKQCLENGWKEKAEAAAALTAKYKE